MMLGFYDSMDGFVAMQVWTILIFILAIAGGICGYIFFLQPKTEVKNKFLNWMKQFLNFDKMLIEAILKITYLVLALYITIWPLAIIFTEAAGILWAILIIVIGNVVLRITYEFSLMLIMIWKNTSEINKKTKAK